MRGSDRDFPDYEALMARTDAPPGSSWGLFGEKDELGTVNFLAPEQVTAAAACIRRGKLFNLDCELGAFDPPVSHQRHRHTHTIFGNNPHHRDDYIDGFYLQATSQIDSLRHVRHPIHGFYNGAPDESIAVGSERNGISRWAERGGIVGRGVLVDLDRYLRKAGAPIDQRSNHPIDVATIDAAIAEQGVEIRTGDILMLRTGWLDFYFNALTDAERGSMPKGFCSPGLLQSRETLAWLWDRRIAVCAADNPAVEAVPPAPDSPFAEELRGVAGVGAGMWPYLMHPQMIAMLGLVLGELWDLEALAADCAADGVWECFVAIKPLNLLGGVGSPANAIAIK